MQIACGSQFAFALDNKGHVFVWGTLHKTIIIPEQVQVPSPVVRIFACYQSVLMEAQDGNYYAYGGNIGGALFQDSEPNLQGNCALQVSNLFPKPVSLLCSIMIGTVIFTQQNQWYFVAGVGTPHADNDFAYVGTKCKVVSIDCLNHIHPIDMCLMDAGFLYAVLHIADVHGKYHQYVAFPRLFGHLQPENVPVPEGLDEDDISSRDLVFQVSLKKFPNVRIKQFTHQLGDNSDMIAVTDTGRVLFLQMDRYGSEEEDEKQATLENQIAQDWHEETEIVPANALVCHSMTHSYAMIRNFAFEFCNKLQHTYHSDVTFAWQ